MGIYPNISYNIDKYRFELSTKEGYWFFQCGTENEANDWMDKIANYATIVGKK